MNLNELLLKELQLESQSTRKILALVPGEKHSWKPHEKSMTIGRLATHVAELPQWLNRVLDTNEFDMAANPFQPYTAADNKELLHFFETKLETGIAALSNATDQLLNEEWIFRRGDFIIWKSSKYEAIRSWMFNHMVHHRGQLSVYLRLLDVPIPGMYGPSADDMIARQKAAEAKA
jgi:uncharacterized damage-inducible protein DinB